MKRTCAVIAVWLTSLIGSGIAIGEPAGPTTKPAEGLVIEQRVTADLPGRGAMPPQTTVFKYQGARMRMDHGTMMSQIMYEDGRIVMLMHFAHRAQVVTASQMKEGIEMGAAMPGQADTPPKATATGEKQKINGYDAEAYTYEQMAFGQTSKVTMWIAKDFPDAKAISAIQRRFKETNKGAKMSGTMSGLMPSGLPDDGYPVRMEAVGPTGGKTVVDIVSAKLTKVEDAEFDVPKDYQQSAMPSPAAGR